MIELKFFGKLGDITGDSLTLSCDGITDVSSVIAHLQSAYPELHREITSPQVMVAVNQAIVPLLTPVGDGDEIAFLPPVTGG